MIVMISAQEPKLEAKKDDRFGRCQWLIKMDTETKQWEAFQNPGVSQSSGAGVAAAQFVVDHKVSMIVSGDFGPHASSAFRAANIEMRLFTSDVSSVQDAIDLAAQGKLPAFE